MVVSRQASGELRKVVWTASETRQVDDENLVGVASSEVENESGLVCCVLGCVVRALRGLVREWRRLCSLVALLGVCVCKVSRFRLLEGCKAVC